MSPPTTIEERLRRTLDAVADQTPVVDELDTVLMRATHRGRPRWVAPALAAALVLAALGAIALAAANDGEPDRLDVAGPAAPLRVVLRDGDDLRLIEATPQTEMSGDVPLGRLWVYAPNDGDVAVADPVVAVLVRSERNGDVADLLVRNPAEISVGGHPASIGAEPDGGWIISWPDASGEGSILVVGRGLDRADLITFAATVTETGPAGGPDGFRPVYEGLDPSFGERQGVGATYESDDGKRLEVIVMEWPGFDPAAFIWRPFGAGASHISEVRGHQGLLIDVEEGSDSLTWMERDDYVVHLSGDAVDPDELVALAEGLREVSVAAWLEHVGPVLQPQEGTTTTVETPTTTFSSGASTTVVAVPQGPWLEVRMSDENLCFVVTIDERIEHCVRPEDLLDMPPAVIEAERETVYAGGAPPEVSRVRLTFVDGSAFESETNGLPDGTTSVRYYTVRVPGPPKQLDRYLFIAADGSVIKEHAEAS